MFTPAHVSCPISQAQLKGPLLIPFLHGGHGKPPGFCPGHPPGSAPRREQGLWAGGRQRPDSPLPGDLHSPDAPSKGPARALPSDQPFQGSEELDQLPLGTLAKAGQPLPHPGPCLSASWGGVLLAPARRPSPVRRGQGMGARGVQRQGGGSLGCGRLVLAPVQHLAPFPLPSRGGLRSSVVTSWSCLEGRAAGSGAAGGSGVGWERGEACSERGGGGPCACVGPAHVYKHVAAREAQTRTWAHRLVRGPGVCCARQRPSAHLCVPLPAPPGAHVSDGDPRPAAQPPGCPRAQA